jgi:hypothetical protein
MPRSLESFLRSARCVGYIPMSDEPDFEKFLSARGLPRADFVIPMSKDISPESVAQELSVRYSDEAVALFMPGRRFDILGTRHGRGHGWYDKLLAQLPPGWIRIGVLKDDILSKTPLVRQSWDQPVDFLLISDEKEGRVIETHARSDVLQS